MNVYQKLGAEKITAIITEFYQRAMCDPIIGHFFFQHDHTQLLKGQLAFSIGMLGGPQNYRGRALFQLHQPLSIRPAHFNRRVTMLRELFAQFQVDADSAARWLAAEEKLRPAIIRLPALKN